MMTELQILAAIAIVGSYLFTWILLIEWLR